MDRQDVIREAKANLNSARRNLTVRPEHLAVEIGNYLLADIAESLENIVYQNTTIIDLLMDIRSRQ